MLTKLVIENFKRLGTAEIELGDTVVFVGPNNSGKTTALQALTLWHLGLTAWVSKKGGGTALDRTGVALNRRELIALPIPRAALLWKDLHTRETTRKDGKQRTSNILITVRVEGVSAGKHWSFGLEFDYANPESFYCRPVELPDAALRETIVSVAKTLRVAYLPPMSGLAPREFRAELGQINVLIGEGQTAQVLRNLCLSIYNQPDRQSWDAVVAQLKSLFGVLLLPPRYVPERSEIELGYKAESGGVELDLSSSGRGLQQTLLLLSYLYVHPGATILLDEPDAHLEVLRQRQTYNLICQVARNNGSQIIAATHSEVVLNEAAGRDTVVAFVGPPHRLNNQGSQLRKALLSIGYEHYLQAEARGWVLYLEGSTDLAILRTFARRLGHIAERCLEQPYADYVNSNTPPTARDRFFGLREAKADLLGIALFDRLPNPAQLQSDESALIEICWRLREIENYLCTPATLLAWAAGLAGPDSENGDLFVTAERERCVAAMQESIEEMETALKTLNKPAPWSGDIKATDDFLDPLFENFLKRIGQPRETMYKKNYHVLAEYIPLDEIAPEIREKLDAIAAVAGRTGPGA